MAFMDAFIFTGKRTEKARCLELQGRSCNGEGPHLCPGLGQNLGALPERGARGGDIVDEENLFFPKRSCVFDHKGPPNPLESFLTGSFHLGFFKMFPLEILEVDGKLQMSCHLPGQEKGLIVSPAEKSERMQGHGRHHIDGLPLKGEEDLGRQPGDRCLVSPILETVDDPGNNFFQDKDRPGTAERRWIVETSPTDVGADLLMGKRITAHGTEGRGDPLQVFFAGGTEGTFFPEFENRSAGKTTLGEEKREYGFKQSGSPLSWPAAEECP